MTFEEWWKSRPVTDPHFYWDKVEAKKAWEAAALAERERCAVTAWLVGIRCHELGITDAREVGGEAAKAIRLGETK